MSHTAGKVYHLSIRVDEETINRLDIWCRERQAARPGDNITKSGVARGLILRGMECDDE